MTSKSEKGEPVVLNAEEREAVVNTLGGLPANLRNKQVAQLLARSVHDANLAGEFRRNPHELFEKCGVLIPSGVTIEVHYSVPQTYHLILPAAEPVSKQPQGGPLELTDADLVTAVESVSFFDNDNVLSDGRDPTTAKDTGDDPGGWSDNARDDGRKADAGRDPRTNNDA